MPRSGCVRVLQQKTSGRLRVSVRGGAGEVVPDDFVHCRDKREMAGRYKPDTEQTIYIFQLSFDMQQERDLRSRLADEFNCTYQDCLP